MKEVHQMKIHHYELFSSVSPGYFYRSRLHLKNKKRKNGLDHTEWTTV